MSQSPTVYHAEPLISLNSLCGEGPVYDSRTDRLYWLDINGNKWFSMELSTKEVSSNDLPGPAGFLALTENPEEILLALPSGLAKAKVVDGALNELGNPFQMPEGIRYNDGKAGPNGTLFAGTMSMKGEAGQGGFYQIRSNSDAQELLSGLSIPNGLAWTRDEKHFFHIDSPARSVRRYSYDLEQDRIDLDSEKVVLNFSDLAPAVPDGMSIDAQDRLWVAFWGGASVRCFNTDTGECEAVVELPVKQVTSCCFSGPDLTDLFITSACKGLSEEEMKEQPHAGDLFHVRLSDSGRASYLATNF